jgi:hypothetical protein
MSVASSPDRKYAVESWTACHLDHPKRFDYLCEAICSITRQSVELGGVRIRVSMSWNEKAGKTQEQIQEGLNKLKLKLKVLSKAAVLECTLQGEKKTQLEHLLYLHKTCRADKDTWILFCDDDDYLMPQYVGELKDCTARALQGTHLLPNAELASDFSGYTARRDVVDALFADEKMLAFTKPDQVFMCDLTIMDYLDRHGAAKPAPPTVFHRLWDNPRTWLQDSKAQRRQLAKEEVALLRQAHGGVQTMQELIATLQSIITATRPDEPDESGSYRPRGGGAEQQG